jgi:glucokinase
MSMSRVLAVDLGGTKTALAVVNADGTVAEYRKMPAERSLSGMAAAIGAAATGVGAAGVVVPGIYDAASGHAWCPNLFGPREVPLRSALREHISHCPVVIDSDRAGYVLGESWLGIARGLRDVVFVAIGTGIGVGILSDGHVVRGAHGIAGAAGWWSLTPEWKDMYRETGCWESEAAGPAVAREAGTRDARELTEAARAGESNALEALFRAADFTGRGIANLISLLDPEMIVLGGGLMHGAGDLLVERIRRTASQWAQPVSAGKCRIELTSLGENAGLLGAARLALELT